MTTKTLPLCYNKALFEEDRVENPDGAWEQDDYLPTMSAFVRITVIPWFPPKNIRAACDPIRQAQYLR